MDVPLSRVSRTGGRSREYRYPFSPFPSGWYRVAWSADLPLGKVLPLRYLGRDLVAFRSDSGRAAVLDAHCPHNGAHLGVGGCVKGEAIRCPFHGWQFDTTGRCTHVPDRDPPRVEIRSWEVREVNGAVLIWFDATGAAPTWEVAPWPEFGSPDWTPFVPIRTWRVRVHVQDLIENSVDVAHFTQIHTHVASQARSESLDIDGAALTHRVRVTFTSNGLARLFPPAKGTITVRLDGLSGVTSRAQVEGDSPLGFTTGFYMTPIDEEYAEASGVMSIERRHPRIVTWFIMRQALRENKLALEQDISVFENKVFVERPLIQPLDGPILPYRRWARQFYPEYARDPGLRRDDGPTDGS